MKEVILNIATHGNERIGFRVVKEIKKIGLDKFVAVQVANARAAKTRRRFVEKDLNRSFPGKKHGCYEERRAYELLPRIKAARAVIDIHSTTSELRDTLIVTKLDAKTRACVRAIRPRYLLIMKATKNNSLISAAKIGVAFEYGNDNDRRAVTNIVAGIERMLEHFGLKVRDVSGKTGIISCFNITSAVEKPRGFRLRPTIKNYRLIRKGRVFATKGKIKLRAEEDFYPILFGQKNYKNYFGFKGKKVRVLGHS